MFDSSLPLPFRQGALFAMAQRVTDFVLFPVPVGGYVKVGLRLSALVGERASRATASILDCL